LGLAVFDFRRRETAELDLPLFYAVEDARPSVSYPRSGVSSDGAPLTGVRICDLTALWAGPLATWLLASLGAVVIKIEPTIRLDGFRALDGRGIYPKGKHVPGNGNRSGLFNALNRNKARIDLDLREPEDRCKFLGLVAGADLVIHNLSPRAVSNLAIERASIVGSGSSRLVTIAMPGFPPGSPERDWRAYGGGIHAVSGLADTGDQRWFIPPVSYPDVLSGFAAAAVATVFLLASLRRGRGWDVELPLLNVASRLHSLGGAGPDGSIRATSAVLSRAAHGPPLVDGAGLHRYPRSPFSGPGVPVPEAPAPALIIP
jgi:crotonobetainyl-CoA:carnitine CoA-transferase CaiB-like acyl-CoA transferase